MRNQQLDQMFETISGPYASAKAALEMRDALDRLIVAVWEYQEAHNAPKCWDLDNALAAASIVNQEFEGGNDETVEAEFHKRGLELVKYRQLCREDFFRRQEQKEREEKAKAKKTKAPKVKLAKAA
jgi:hypothetical protein